MMQSSCFDSLLSHNGLEQLVQPLGFPGEVQCAEQASRPVAFAYSAGVADFGTAWT